MSKVVNPRPGMNVSIKVDGGSFPKDGNIGDVLTKTDSGVEWAKPTGGVKTINGVFPDENGNVVLDTLKDQITQDDVLDYLIKDCIVDPVTASNNAVFTDDSGKLYTL